MKIYTAALFALAFASCASRDSGSPFAGISTVKTKTVRYLYELKYNSSDYPYGLWSFPIRGDYDEMHKQVAIIPEGYMLTIDRAKVDKDFYGPDIIKVEGSLVSMGKKYDFTFGCSSLECSQQFEMEK